MAEVDVQAAELEGGGRTYLLAVQGWSRERLCVSLLRRWLGGWVAVNACEAG